MRDKGIQAYQDYTFMINDRPDRRLDDEQLLTDWRAAFPIAKGKVFTGSLKERLAIIRGVRRDYNNGVGLGIASQLAGLCYRRLPGISHARSQRLE